MEGCFRVHFWTTLSSLFYWSTTSPPSFHPPLPSSPSPLYSPSSSYSFFLLFLLLYLSLLLIYLIFFLFRLPPLFTPLSVYLIPPRIHSPPSLLFPPPSSSLPPPLPPTNTFPQPPQAKLGVWNLKGSGWSYVILYNVSLWAASFTKWRAPIDCHYNIAVQLATPNLKTWRAF